MDSMILPTLLNCLLVLNVYVAAEAKDITYEVVTVAPDQCHLSVSIDRSSRSLIVGRTREKSATWYVEIPLPARTGWRLAWYYWGGEIAMFDRERVPARIGPGTMY